MLAHVSNGGDDLLISGQFVLLFVSKYPSNDQNELNSLN